MQICPACGTENREGARFCDACAAALTAPAPERRKLATLVFCDMSGSTAMGERVDAETVQSLMLAYFHEMRGALERHGGTVEKFVGDAVLAVFGVPEAHEDDALRACRAALEMRARLDALNEDLEQRFGARIALRIGVNTGEVVARDASGRETFVTGDAVNVAARLEQTAAPGEILLGEPTFRLVRDAVTVEAVEPLMLKGKSEPLAAYRLLEVTAFGPAPRRVGTPLAGREPELALLQREFEAAVEERRCRLVTVIGEPGVGKSRLAAELVARVGTRARVGRGGCLSYGEGITYWAVGQIVRDLAGIRDEHSAEQARARLEGVLEPLEGGPVAAGWVAQLLGLAEGSTTSDQTALGVARFLAAAAGERPLVVLVDDIQWAEPALLDLLAGLPAMAGDAPLLVCCLARPELLEARSEWPVTVRLEALAEADLAALLQSLGAPEEACARLAQASAGNPLFAEVVAWALERDGSGDAMPTSLNALLGSRLDRLESQARDALERGAIEGEFFHRGAVVELSEPESRQAVPTELEALADRDLVRPTPASFAGEAAFRFKHILVREAAYQATAKKLRGSLHERFATWLERLAGERLGEYEEILGYHLEQAFRYRTELGPADDSARALAARAAGHLGPAGRRAADRGDVHAAANLLGRATDLLPADSAQRLELLLPYGYSLTESGRALEARARYEELEERATALGDRGLAAHARVHRLQPNDPTGDTVPIAETLIETFTELGDDVGLAQANRVLGMVYRVAGRMVDSAARLERALEHANAGGDLVTRRTVTQALSMAFCHGPMPVVEATARCQELREANRDDRLLDAVLGRHLSSLLAMAGRFDDAREQWEAASLVLDAANLFSTSWVSQMHAAAAKELAGDRAGAERDLKALWQHSRDVLGGAPQLNAMTAAYMLAYLYCADGRWDEVAECLAFHRDAPVLHDAVPASYKLAAAARLASHRDEEAEAAVLADSALEIAERTDMLNLRALVWLAAADVRRARGEATDADAATATATALYEQKGNVAAAARLRAGAATA